MGWGESAGPSGPALPRSDHQRQLEEYHDSGSPGFPPLGPDDRAELEWWREFRTRQGPMTQLPPVGHPHGGRQYAVFDLTTRAATEKFLFCVAQDLEAEIRRRCT